MRLIFITVLVLCLSSEYTIKCSEDEFVDHLDMLNYDKSTKSMRKSKPNTVVGEPIQNDRCTIFLTRFINILLINTGLPSIDQVSNEKEYKELKSLASVTLSVKDLQLLKNMVNKRDIDYTEIDRILNSLFTPLPMNSDEFKAIGSNFEIYDQIKEVLFWVSIGSLSIALLYIIFQQIRYVTIVTFILFIVFALSFASTWYTMYTKAGINREVHFDNMPSHCHTKTGWNTFSWFQTNNLDDCKKYKEAIKLDPKYSIAITDVLAEMLSKIMMKPIETLGESIYVFNKSVLKDIPYWAQLILIPIIIIIIIKTIFLSTALLVGRGLSMKYIFGYGGSTIGPGPTGNHQCRTNDRINNSFHPVPTIQHTTSQIPELPKVNFNVFNLGSTENTHFSFEPINDKFKINYKKESNLIAMLKNKEIDSVDSKSFNGLSKKAHRHRTLSI
ncbi:chloride channel CLIC-like protein 1 [Rhopalosiphum padi]|uniref:chloride channel CLIC-like protein 1 n=1 Tax=Rhopalosiphum padi TaxID=40932 RepID=UPI00298E88FC|nr:chloride channel CLIC-like protein 1 [Rhopalosiphum padi]